MSACDLHLVVCALAREFVGLGEPSSGVELYREDVDGEASENPHAASVSGICNEMRGGKVCALAWEVARRGTPALVEWRITTATYVRCPAAPAAHLSHLG